MLARLYILSLYILLFSSGKSKPELMRYFTDGPKKWGKRCHNYVVLSSDSVFFVAGDCENDIAVNKGRWSFVNRHVVLTEFDSAKCIPVARVSYRKFHSADSVRITCTDYFGNPFYNTAICIYDSAGKEEFESPDKNGSVTVSKKQCEAFVPIYMLGMSGEYPSRRDTYQKVETSKNDISIAIDFPNEIGLVHDFFVHHFGKPTEYIWNDSVLFNENGEVLYKAEQF